MKSCGRRKYQGLNSGLLFTNINSSITSDKCTRPTRLIVIFLARGIQFSPGIIMKFQRTLGCWPRNRAPLSVSGDLLKCCGGGKRIDLMRYLSLFYNFMIIFLLTLSPALFSASRSSFCCFIKVNNLVLGRQKYRGVSVFSYCVNKIIKIKQKLKLGKNQQKITVNNLTANFRHFSKSKQDCSLTRFYNLMICFQQEMEKLQTL